jgi:hypothetical protein
MTNQSDNEAAADAGSPACSMHEADDGYMGYVTKDELVAFLNELLEAERAGGRARHARERPGREQPSVRGIDAHDSAG